MAEHFDHYSGGNAATYNYDRRQARHYEMEDQHHENEHDDDYEMEEEGSYDLHDHGDYTQTSAGPSSDCGNSHTSLLDPADRNDPNYLYSILHEANNNNLNSHHQNNTSALLTEQQRRDQAELVWERVRRWLWANPHPAQRQALADVRGVGDATCLHLVCKLHNPPEDIVSALLSASDNCIRSTDAHGWLPLHHACANGATPEVMQLLIDAYPDAKLTQDQQNRTPLHFFATRGSNSSTSGAGGSSMLSSACDNPAAAGWNAELLSDTGAAALTDRSGMLPMHYAAAYGTHPTVLKALAKAHAPSLVATEHNGRTPMHLAMVNAHRVEAPNVMRFLLEQPASRATIDKRDRDGYLPLHLLALALKGYRSVEHERRANVSECLSMYLAAEPHAAADFLTAIQDLPDWLQDTAVVSKHVRNILNEKIVQRFPTSMMMGDGIALAVLVVSFALATSHHINLRFDPENLTEYREMNTGAHLVLILLGSFYFFCRELVQVGSLMSLGSLSSWWTDPANYLDMAVITFCSCYGILMLANDNTSVSNELFRAGAVLTQGILWVAIIVFLKSTLVDFAVFVGGVFYVVRRLVAFMIAVSAILFAFAEMFYFVYFRTDICILEEGEVASECDFPHCRFEYSLLKVYTMMMGEIGDETRYSTSLAAQILYVSYAFVVVILLSNVLIAIVTDSYEIIQNDRAAIVFWSNRLDFVAEMDAITYAVQRRLGKASIGESPTLMREQSTRQSARNLVANMGIDREEGVPMNGRGIPESSENDFDPFISSYDDSTEFFREAWHQVMLLFDANLYEDIDWIEIWVYNIFRIFSIFCVIPVWVALGAVTAGSLWPPQVREWIFVQKETEISRAELERQKLSQLMAIQTDLKALKQDIMREMANDRDEMIRMKAEVEAVQGEVYADLQQVKELMGSLLAT